MSDHKANEQNSLNILEDLVAKALKRGAEGVDAVRIQATSTSGS